MEVEIQAPSAPNLKKKIERAALSSLVSGHFPIAAAGDDQSPVSKLESVLNLDTSF